MPRGVAGDEQRQPAGAGSDPLHAAVTSGVIEFELASPIRLPTLVEVQDRVGRPLPAGERVMVAVEVQAEVAPRRERVQPAAVAVPVAERPCDPQQIRDRQTEHPTHQFCARWRQPERVFGRQLAVVIAMPERPAVVGPLRFGRPDQLLLGPVVDDSVGKRNGVQSRVSRVQSRRCGTSLWTLDPLLSSLLSDNRGHTCTFQDRRLPLSNSTDKALAKQVQFLKAENEVLRARLPKRIVATPKERARLLKFGKPLGSAIKDLITIVKPRTFARWVSGAKKSTKPADAKGPGRPRKPDDIRELILKLARENGWGYTRILGELKKLGITTVSRSTVVNILKENGLQPGPDRGEGTWDEFLKRHKETLWACDFFSKHVWTKNGLVEYFVLFFIHLGSRRVHVSGMTAQPDGAWMLQQARNVSAYFADEPVKPTMILCDHDTKFTAKFEEVLSGDGIKLRRVGPMAPNMNAYAERWVQAIEQECLDHFVVFGEDHLRHLVGEYVAHFLEERPHQGLGNVPVKGLVEPVSRDGPIQCKERLGGLLKHYHRAAA